MNWSDKEPLVYSCYYNSKLLGYLEYQYMGREEYPTTVKADIIKHFELPKGYNPKEISWRYIENDPLDETKPLVKINESLKFKTTDKLCSVVLNGRQYFAGTKEECEKFIKDHESEQAARDMGGYKLLNTAGIYVDESLTEEGDLDRLLDSDEFKTPVSKEEINAARREVEKESLEEKCGKQKITEESDSEIAAIINSWEDAPEAPVEEPEFNEDDIDELDECSLNKHIDEYLKEVYSNVKSYETTDCELKEGKLIVEGKISFNSGKEKLTMFEFLPAYCEGKLFFEGYNKDFSEDKAFKLNCSINESKTLITESFGYKYKINENLVEGLK